MSKSKKKWFLLFAAALAAIAVSALVFGCSGSDAGQKEPKKSWRETGIENIESEFALSVKSAKTIDGNGIADWSPNFNNKHVPRLLSEIKKTRNFRTIRLVGFMYRGEQPLTVMFTYTE